MSRPSRLPRSFLYAPGDRPEIVAKAFASIADAVVVDLEDAVAAPRKAAARAELPRILAESPARGPEAWVRVAAESLGEDLDAAVRPGLAGVVLATCEPPALHAAALLIERLERERGLGHALPLVGLIESAAGLLALGEMSRHPRLTTFGVGEVDLLADLGLGWTAPRWAVDELRLRIVVHAAAAGLAAPVAPTNLDVADSTGQEASTRELIALGFRARTALHPRQLPGIHAALLPDDADLARAREIVERAERSAVGMDAAGRFIDAAVVRAARDILDRAARR